MLILLAGVFAVLIGTVSCGPLSVSISTEREHKFGDDIVCDVTISNSHNWVFYLLARSNQTSFCSLLLQDGKMVPAPPDS